jgi:hypothetical protein
MDKETNHRTSSSSTPTNGKLCFRPAPSFREEASSVLADFALSEKCSTPDKITQGKPSSAESFENAENET